MAEDYLRGSDELEPIVGAEHDEADDMATGTVQDQLVYQELDANRIPPPADAKARRKRSPARERTAPAPRKLKARSKR